MPSVIISRKGAQFRKDAKTSCVPLRFFFAALRETKSKKSDKKGDLTGRLLFRERKIIDIVVAAHPGSSHALLYKHAGSLLRDGDVLHLLHQVRSGRYHRCL
jgi:hypothetical protein